jgi:hypothetical protein
MRMRVVPVMVVRVFVRRSVTVIMEVAVRPVLRRHADSPYAVHEAECGQEPGGDSPAHGFDYFDSAQDSFDGRREKPERHAGKNVSESARCGNRDRFRIDQFRAFESAINGT